MRHYLAVLFLVTIIAIPWMAFNYPDGLNQIVDSLVNRADELAAVINHNPKTVAGLQSKYNTVAASGQQKIRVLIFPGHEPDEGGAEYGDIKERDLVVTLANDLADFLQKNGRYQVFVTRDTQNWNPTFADYFRDHWNEIIDWKKSYRDEMSRMISLGQVTPDQPVVIHNNAAFAPAQRLYGVTKWSNENNIDVMIHVHLNDYPGHGDSPGKYSGFAIYVPSGQYYNSSTTHAIADTVFKRLAKYNAVSDMPQEASGIIDDPELIAIGANNTSDAPSMLIEYGYLYESQFTNPAVRDLALKDLAYQTYLGLQDFFDPTNAVRLANSYDTLILPHVWTSPLSAQKPAPSDVYALQTALLNSGLYPPAARGLNDCPRTGKLGPCTKASLDVFQRNNNISDEKGIVGPKTLEVLNKAYGIRTI